MRQEKSEHDWGDNVCESDIKMRSNNDFSLIIIIECAEICWYLHNQAHSI